MTLVRLISDDEAAPAARETFEAGKAVYGQVLNTWRAIAHNPQALAAYLPYLRAVLGPGALEQRIKELTAVRTAVLNRCRYSASHRIRSARAQNVPDEDIAAVAEGRFDGFAPREQLALRFADQLTLNPAGTPFSENEQAVDPALLRELKSEFTDAELVELALVVSLWNYLARFHRVMGFELDMDPPPPEVERLL